jgi:hypothetical protein
MSTFDRNSGIRERLALLAEIGPTADADRFVYDSHRDAWTLRTAAVKVVKVRQEGSRSLEMIAERWKLDRKSAMAVIGYPEATR